jgi:hypothetical protein
MKNNLLALLLLAQIVLPVFAQSAASAASECGASVPVAVVPSASEQTLSLERGSLQKQDQSDACSLSMDQWGALPSSPHTVVDARQSASRVVAAIPEAIVMTLSTASRHRAHGSPRTLLIADTEDERQALSACNQLRKNGNKDVFVLSGGARAWFAVERTIDSNKSRQSILLNLARIDVGAASRWVNDLGTSTELIDASNTDWLPTVLRPLPANTAQRLLLVAPNQANAFFDVLFTKSVMLPLHTSWVIASKSELDAMNEKAHQIALAANTPLNRSCGVQ